MINEADSFADKTERHRRIVTTRAGEVFNVMTKDAELAGLRLCEFDTVAIWQGCINAAEHEWRAGFLAPRVGGDMRVLPR